MSNENMLAIIPYDLDPDYAKEWNDTSNDYFKFVKNGKIGDELYRMGGIGGFKFNNKFSLILKYVEAYYSDDITTDPDRKKHLDGLWCIVDSDANEMIVFDKFINPYIVSDSCVYRLENNYYNIKTNELYCYSHSSCESKKHLVLESFKDKKLYLIDKSTGDYTIIS